MNRKSIIQGQAAVFSLTTLLHYINFLYRTFVKDLSQHFHKNIFAEKNWLWCSDKMTSTCEEMTSTGNVYFTL